MLKEPQTKIVRFNGYELWCILMETGSHIYTLRITDSPIL